MQFKVLRRHLGDKMYMPGDTREATEGDVTHLIRQGVLQPERKSEPAPKNKAEKAPQNKGE